MGDLTSGITSGLGDVLSNIGNFASNIGGDISSGIGDIFSGAPAVDPSLSPTSIAPTAGSDAANLVGPASGFGADSVTPATVAGTFGDISGLGDVVSQMPPVFDPLSGAPTANIPFQMPGPTPGTQATTLLEQPSTGAQPTLPVPPQPPTAGLDAPLKTGVMITPTGSGAAGGGGSTAAANTPTGAGGGGEADILKPGPDLGTSGSGSNTGGGILDWLSNQLTGPGSLKNDLQMLAALGGLGMSAFKPNAVPGAGQALTAGPTSTGQAVSTAQRQQNAATGEQATVPQQEALAGQQQGISAKQVGAAGPLLATGEQQVSAAASGQLTPAQEAFVAQSLKDNQEQIRAKYASLGLSGSTMEITDLNGANNQNQVLRAGLLNQNQTQGLSTITGGENLLAGAGTSLQGASSDINQVVNALQNSVSALGSAGGTYLEILKTQLAQDQDLQKALSQMAGGLGTSTALSNLGGTASTAGATAA